MLFLHPNNPAEYQACQIKMDINGITTSFYQDMLVWDFLFLEEMFEEYGSVRFNPIFNGEKIYLGMRDYTQLELSIGDLVAQKLRGGMRDKISKLNEQQKKMHGALTIPENPPLFILRLLSTNPNRENLAEEIIKLRESRAFKRFRKSASECQDMLSSSDLEIRSKASRFIISIEELDLDKSTDYVGLTNKGFDVLDAISQGLSGSIIGPLKQVLELSNDLFKAFSEQPMTALKEFKSTKVDTKSLDEFVQLEFGDNLHADEMLTISYLLGLPISSDDWEKLDATYSVSISQSHYDLNARNLTIVTNPSYTSEDTKNMSRDMFGKDFGN